MFQIPGHEIVLEVLGAARADVVSGLEELLECVEWKMDEVSGMPCLGQTRISAAVLFEPSLRSLRWIGPA